MRYFSALLIATLLTIAGFLPGAFAECELHQSHTLAQAVYVNASIGSSFDLVVTISAIIPPRFFFFDSSGAMCADWKRASHDLSTFHAGDVVRIKGHIILSEIMKIPVADCESIEFLNAVSPQKPFPITPSLWNDGKLDFRPVTLSGHVIDIRDDEIDTRFRVLLLDCGGASVQIPVEKKGWSATNVFARLGHKAVAAGICNPVMPMTRLFNGRSLELIKPSDIRFLDTPPVDLFDVPPLYAFQRIRNSGTEVFSRRKAKGLVLAVYRQSCALLRLDEHQTIEVRFATVPPHSGDTVEVSGFPSANSYTLQLHRALWRIADTPIAPTPADIKARKISINNLLHDEHGNLRYNKDCRGKRISVTGTIRILPDSIEGKQTAYIDDNGNLLAIECEPGSSFPSTLSQGALIEAKGVCIMTEEPILPGSHSTQIHDCLLSFKDTNDLTIIHQPSWWTTTRLFYVIGFLAFLLTGIITWNIALRRLVERRSAELAQNQLAKAEAEIKTMERTRLAVELHDSLAQNLAGIALELQTVDIFSQKDHDRAHDHLARATRSLLSCRQELRNCLWDLRSDALGKSSMDEAISVMLEPILGNVTCAIRLAIPRTRLTENTTLTILKIIRELVLNAIQHGGASQVKIAGAVEGDSWHVSVRDNGHGFNPANRPSVRDGHFGLQGVRERVQSLGGTLEIESAPGKGTRVSFMAPWPHLGEYLDKSQKERLK